ncbi:MAG: glycosyltransferase family 1 protein [Flavobacterium sp.]|nr:MAG: glycosyltransferase family 1 protein [Flavobacterium sp.]
MKKLAVVTTHPIQYYAPVFQLLAARNNIELCVFYSGGEKGFNDFDKGFNRKISWDIPLLQGYDHKFLLNTAKKPGSHHFFGVINPDIIQCINNFAPDAILVYGWAWSGHLKVIDHFTNKIPVWFRGDSTLLNNTKGLKAILKTIFLKWVYSKIEKAFFVGKNNKDYFLKYGVPERKLMFAPHAIDNERFNSDPSNGSKVRAAFKISNEAILILFAGKLDPDKDPQLLLEAFLQAKLTDSHLLFVGNGSLEKDLKDKCRDLGVKNVYFMDFQNQSYMPEIYSACDLFCLPSRSETWGLAVNEAMAAGKAILASDKTGCASDLILEGKNGGIFLSGDLNDLIINLENLCHKGKLQDLGAESLKIIENWSFNEQVIAFESQL